MIWQTKKLGEVCEINMGQSPASSTYNQNKKGLPFYQGKKDYGEIHPTPRVWCSEPIKIVEKDDILISVRAPVGALNIAEEKSCIGRGLTGLRANKSILDQSYLYKFLKLKEKEISDKGTGSTFTAISKKDIENLKIPLPPLEIQNKIVKILDEKFAKIREAKSLREEALADTEKILSQNLREIFEDGKEKGWKEKKIGEILHIKHGWAFKGEFFGKIGDILLTPGNFKEDGGLYFTDKNTKRYSGDFSHDLILVKNDLVIVMTDLSKECKILGNPAIVGEKMLHNQRIGKIELLTKEITKEFLYYFFLTKNYKDLVKSTATGTTVRHTAPSRIYNIKIQFPPLIEQKKIVERLDALSGKLTGFRELQKSQLVDFKKLKKSYLREAFNGELI